MVHDDKSLGSKEAVEVGYAVKIEPQPLVMVTDKNKA